ncbi:MAG: hypothetical protein LBM96_00650 [Methanobrevibacter sp.]|jgi:hypothetical protein|nr:hypothetical protein [Candidatus Methanoflexus mossambicus]
MINNYRRLQNNKVILNEEDQREIIENGGSSIDFTSADRIKLDSIENGAEVNIEYVAGEGISINGNVISSNNTGVQGIVLDRDNDNDYGIILGGDYSTGYYAYACLASGLITVVKATGTYFSSGNYTEFDLEYNNNIGWFVVTTDNVNAGMALTNLNNAIFTRAKDGVTQEDLTNLTSSLTNLIAAKVDKITGKGLSTNDLTNELVNKINTAIQSVGDGTINIKQNNTTKGTFTVNQSGDITINLSDTTYSLTTSTSNGLQSSADKAKLDNIEDNAEVNQNAFSNFKIGSNTIAADNKTDTVEFVAGTNMSLIPDVNNDKLTFNGPSMLPAQNLGSVTDYSGGTAGKHYVTTSNKPGNYQVVHFSFGTVTSNLNNGQVILYFANDKTTGLTFLYDTPQGQTASFPVGKVASSSKWVTGIRNGNYLFVLSPHQNADYTSTSSINKILNLPTIYNYAKRTININSVADWTNTVNVNTPVKNINLNVDISLTAEQFANMINPEGNTRIYGNNKTITITDNTSMVFYSCNIYLEKLNIVMTAGTNSYFQFRGCHVVMDTTNINSGGSHQFHFGTYANLYNTVWTIASTQTYNLNIYYGSFVSVIGTFTANGATTGRINNSSGIFHSTTALSTTGTSTGALNNYDFVSGYYETGKLKLLNSATSYTCINKKVIALTQSFGTYFTSFKIRDVVEKVIGNNLYVRVNAYVNIGGNVSVNSGIALIIVIPPDSLGKGVLDENGIASSISMQVSNYNSNSPAFIVTSIYDSANPKQFKLVFFNPTLVSRNINIIGSVFVKLHYTIPL